MFLKSNSQKLIALLSKKAVDVEQIRTFGSDEVLIEFFMENWISVSSGSQRNMISFASETIPEIGIKIIVTGYRSATSGVRYEAKTAIEKIVAKINIPIGTSKNNVIKTSAESSKFVTAIYREIIFFKSIGDKKYYIQTLLKVGGRGPYYAWKYFLTVYIKVTDFTDILKSLSEMAKLTLAYQYTLLELENRQRFATHINGMLATIKSKNRSVVTDFFSQLYDHEMDVDPLLIRLALRLQLDKVLLKNEIVSRLPEKNIIGLKVMSFIDKQTASKICVKMLPSDKKSLNKSSSIKIAALSVLVRIYNGKGGKKNLSTIKAVLPFLNATDMKVVLSAFKMLVTYKTPNIGKVVISVLSKQPKLLNSVCEIIYYMSLPDIYDILESVLISPSGIKLQNRFISLIAMKFLQSNPEKMISCVECIKTADFPKKIDGQAIIKDAKKFNSTIKQIVKKELKALKNTQIPDKKTLLEVPKGLLDIVPVREQKKMLTQLEEEREISGCIFQGEDICDHDFSECKLMEVSFKNTNLENINIKKSNLTHLFFRDTIIKGVKFDNATFDYVTFENCYLLDVSFNNSNMKDCYFFKTSIYNSTFNFTKMPGTVFIDVNIKNTNFTEAVLDFSSMNASKLELVSFMGASLLEFDLCGSFATLCKFDKTSIFNTSKDEYANLDNRTSLLSKLTIPSSFFYSPMGASKTDKKKLPPKREINHWFNLILMFMGMEQHYKMFLKYNTYRIKTAMDEFRSNQGDLFELIPFLINANIDSFSKDKLNTGTPFGIFNYFPSQNVTKLAEKYPLKLKNINSTSDRVKPYAVHGLFTTGNTGSIEQTAISAINYWVCIDKTSLGENNIRLLKKKLNTIEKWALNEFNLVIHFDLMDILKLQQNMGGSEKDENVSLVTATIIKEEFYRTMIYIAGKIPFWNLCPLELKKADYTFLFKKTSSYYPQAFDLGNLSNIPILEYLLASMSLIFTKTDNPFNMIINIAVLEMYIRNKKTGRFLSNILKERWSVKISDLVAIDPYLVLYEQISSYYRKMDLAETGLLVGTCFFLNLGIESLEDLNKTKMGVKKELVYQCMTAWNWGEKEFKQFGYFNEWSFKQVFTLGLQIHAYMLKAFGRGNTFMEESPQGKAFSQSKEIAALRVRAFSSLTDKQFKIRRNPMVLQRGCFFDEIYFNYREKNKRQFIWEILHRVKKKKGDDKKSESNFEVICERSKIEEIAAWFVYNGLYSPDTRFTLRPNPTPVLHQDIIELFKAMDNFFQNVRINDIPIELFFKNPTIDKMFIMVNFNLKRILGKIHEYSIIYSNTWGEIFSRTFINREGQKSMQSVINTLNHELSTQISTDNVFSFLPRSAVGIKL